MAAATRCWRAFRIRRSAPASSWRPRRRWTRASAARAASTFRQSSASSSTSPANSRCRRARRSCGSSSSATRRASCGFGSEQDLVRILKYPAASIACDCGATLNTRQHPRAWGSFPRVLGRYVREQHVLTWEDAIRKMTALPANTIGMIDRGYIAPGMAADITVFDPNTVIDRATYEDPAQVSEGIRDVIVNGVVALRNGKPTGERGGRVLARSPHMPSRPMHGITTARRFAARGIMADGRRLTIDLAQPARAPRATGTFRLLDAHGAALIDAATLGVLQTMKGWTSITGVARSQPGGALRPFTAVVEQADPFVAGTPRTLSVEVPGQPVVIGVLR